ncbi:hypothetical protein Glove_197g91 [Diversispora epigaea]|uniref:Suppressor of forked domain-containing protein n=1 Tax=Diversispora epigaea TaxID=1348612 RepID=A0A397IUW8_9GLOM|nr:hypothetical protein Glove_197g91 [Diversispora epigaea]
MSDIKMEIIMKKEKRAAESPQNYTEHIVPTHNTREETNSRNNSYMNDLISNPSANISGNINRPNFETSPQKVTTREPPPAAEPASWQIPPSALQTKKQMKNIQIEKYESRISENGYDIEAWLGLLTEVQAKADVDKVRESFERFLQKFPTSSRQWVQCAEFELKNQHYDRVETIFTRCLRSVLSVDLWKFYLNYVRRMHQIEKGSASTSQARTTISSAYEYVLNHIGLDKDAGTIWSDFLFFLKTGETSSTWEEQQKMDTMRKAYQKAICIPLNNVELIWKEYDQFENSLNKVTAKKFLQDRSPAYMTARTAVKEMRRFTDKINKNIIPTPPKWTKSEKEQLAYWKEWIEWEKSNPLALEDQSLLKKRIIYVYKQAMMYLRFYPEIWFDAANYWASIKKEEEAVSLLKTAMEIMPTSFLVHFSYAEMQEKRNKYDESRSAYETLLSNVQSQIVDIEKATEAEVKVLMQSSPESGNEDGDAIVEMDGETREQLRIKEKEREKERLKFEESKQQEINELEESCGLIWIMLMRFTRRTEGIKAARVIFSRARKYRQCPYRVFVAAALMEYHCTKDQLVAAKIFELGLRTYGTNPDYVLQYLDFLIQLNDDINARSVFERTLVFMPADKAKIIWKRFSDYENKYGHITAIQKLDERRGTTYPEESSLERFAERYSFLDTNIICKKEVGPKPDPETGSSSSTTAQNDEEQDAAPTRRALLDSVHPEKYPRPDFRQWVLYKPSAEQLRRPFFPQPGASGQQITNISTTGNSVQPLGPSQPIISQPHGSTLQPPTASQTPQNIIQPSLNWARAPNGMMVPDTVNKFLLILPPPSSYNGPIINSNELMELIRNSVPTTTNIMSVPPTQHSLQPSQTRDKTRGGSPARGDGRGYADGRYGEGSRIYDRSMENGRGGSGPGRLGKQMRGASSLSQRGRGTSETGISTSQFNKRRRRDFDETEEFQGRGGPGINRPPDYDLFRARQQRKRARNESSSFGQNSATVE